MWAAANSSSGRTRPQQDSDWDSDSSGERSTTESIHGDKPLHDIGTRPSGADASAGRKRRKKKKRRKEESPEAAVARLTSSYSAAMVAVGALHRVSRQICNENNTAAVDDEDENSGIVDVGQGEERTDIQAVDDSHVDISKVTQAEKSGDMQIETEKTSDEHKNKDTAANKLEESKATLEKVAQSARTSLEQSLLLDPIIMAPILLPNRTFKNIRTANDITEDIPVQNMTSAWYTICNHSGEVSNMAQKQLSVSKWKKLSAAHKNTVKQIAYLSLVNYADLLLCGCSCCHSSSGDMLDRKPVQSLEVLNLFQGQATQQSKHCSGCLWGETKEKTLRLALASYCDASELDPSDPTLWFKVACTARALGRVIDLNKSPSDTWRPTSYRSLERLALERGLNSLPKGVPPNRMLMRAWKEMEGWDKSMVSQISEESDSVMTEETINEPIKLVVHLPHNSWSTLGRILIRACKEGASYGRSSSVSHVWSTNCKTPEDYEFGSPLMDIQISPILSLPNDELASVCCFLGKGSNDVKNLACTCKALQAETLLALTTKRGRVTSDSNAAAADDRLGQSLNDEVESISAAAAGDQPPSSSDTTEKLTIDLQATNPVSQPMTSPNLKRSSSNSPRPAIPGERVSKRVRSQKLTSEKESERQAKRSSVEYCLLAGALSCTPQNPNYTTMSKAEYDWNQLPVLKTWSDMITLPEVGRTVDKQVTLTNRGVTSSLKEFIETASEKKSGPRHLLECFLIHVAVNSADVFGDYEDDPSSCFLECFGLLMADNVGDCEICFPWYGHEELTIVSTKCIYQEFAVNLLFAELSFKRTTKKEAISDAQSLASIISSLLKFVVAMPTEDNDVQMKTKVELSCRCYWLACEYYFWLSRRSNDSLLSADSERLAMESLNKALQVLGGSAIRIPTPHLRAPHREGRYWSTLSFETLSAYSEELQSSSVVSRARNEFIDIGRALQSETLLDHTVKLTKIGTDLFNWYCKGDSKGSLKEVVNDFILHHQDSLNKPKPIPTSSTKASDWLGRFYWGDALWSCISTSRDGCDAGLASAVSLRPSISQVLVCSLLLSEENINSVLVVLAQLSIAALEINSRLVVAKGYTLVKEGVDEELDSQNAGPYEQSLTVANYFMDKLIVVLNSEEISVEGINTEALSSVRKLAHRSICMLPINSNGCPSLTQFHFFQSISQYMSAMRARKLDSFEDTECIYFATLAKVFHGLKENYLRLVISDKRTKSWQIRFCRIADYACHVANELAEYSSLYPTSIDEGGKLIISPLIKATLAVEECKGTNNVPVVKLYESAVWFFNHATKSSEKGDLIRIRLLKPAAALIASLCGTFGLSVGTQSDDADMECDKSDSCSDYFETDDSVQGSFLHDDTGNGSKRTLKKLNQLIQCISLVYSVAEKTVCYEYAPFMSPSYKHGPFLSLIIIRVLSGISDNLFRLFSQEVWDDEYPYGARSCGAALDNMLASAYRAVYGISLVGHAQNASDASNDSTHLPESLGAAAQLFRCVKRLFRRKALPIRALELIDKVLPPPQETAVNSAIRAFLFNGNEGDEITESSQSANEPPINFPEWILSCTTTPATESESDRLRKMVSSELAKGSITHLNSNQVPGDDDDGLTEERELTRSHELSLYNKFRVLLDDLSVNPSNVENWVVLSETCGFKADIICDRLVATNHPFNLASFRPLPNSMNTTPANMTLKDMKQSQFDEFNGSQANWVPFLGNDLSVYMQHSWSSFSSLQACEKDIESKLSGEDRSVLKELKSKFERGEFISWAIGWAGMFVFALRRMKIRSLMVARYLAKKTKENGDLHPSDICEDLGTALYGDLVGSTSYGYPIMAMTDHEKRKIAQSAKTFFEEAIQLSKSYGFGCKCEIVPWENQFMIGKCHEKIASTLCEEAFPTDEQSPRRSYETSLKFALQSYSNALADAKEREQSSGSKHENGGSSHGSMEVFYRIHACRLKALLFSARRMKVERKAALLEAIHITSAAWFGDLTLEPTSSTIRHKVWSAFVNCTKALIHCRTEEPKFHRSAFRLAQAYNWVPVFQDPESHDFVFDNKKDIPSVNGISLPCIEAGSCNKNAALAMESLFDKRRSQLCAVWVTTSTTPPPFEVINDPVRKYDYLRLKYIMAYIDCMKRTKKMDKIESLLNCTSNCAQDLAGFYQASAAVKGMDPGRHKKQSLLKASGFLSEVKRCASVALSELVLANLAYLKQHGVDVNGRAELEACLKLSNSLFLRMNTSPNEAVQCMLSTGSIIQIVALCKCFISIQAGYRINDSIKLEKLDKDTLLSFVEQALEKAKNMFSTKSKQQSKK